MAGNEEQIAEWNGVLGEKWVTHRHATERVVGSFGNAAMALAQPQPAERVVDIGCGCGDTSIALAQAVGPQGRVVGVDVSQPMLEEARTRPESRALSNLDFIEADAASFSLQPPCDLVYSRFGVMFFGDPEAAFANMWDLLGPGGRMTFCCWRHPRENPWAMAPLVAARKALGVEPAQADLNAPGPFAFHDRDRLSGILSGAGFTDVSIAPFAAELRLGDSVQEAVDGATRIGPVSRLLRDVEPARIPEAIKAVETAFAQHVSADGAVLLGGAVWLVAAQRT